MFQNKEQIPFVVPEQQRCTRSRAAPCLTELPLLCLVPGAQRYVGFVVMGRAMQRKDRIVSSPAPMETEREKLQYGFELVSGSGSVPGSIQTPDLSCRVFIVIKFGSDRVKSTSLFLIFSSKVAPQAPSRALQFRELVVLQSFTCQQETHLYQGLYQGSPSQGEQRAGLTQLHLSPL